VAMVKVRNRASMDLNLSADLSQVALSWTSAPIPTADSNRRRCHCKVFPKKINAATHSVVASTHRTRRFSSLHPPTPTCTAHRRRTASARRPYCP
jgi:hypothetical protein